MFTVFLAALILDIPQPADYLWRFPDAAVTKSMLELNDAITQRWMDERSIHGVQHWHWKDVWNYPEWKWYTTAIAENRACREPWVELAAFQACQKDYALVRLQKSLGGDLSGRMPCPIAVWRLRDH